MITVFHRPGVLYVNGHAEKDPRCCAATGVLLWTLHTRHGAPQPVDGRFKWEYDKEAGSEISFVMDALTNLAKRYPYEVEIK